MYNGSHGHFDICLIGKRGQPFTNFKSSDFICRCDSVATCCFTSVGSWDAERWETYKKAFQHNTLGDCLERFMTVITNFMNDTGDTAGAESVLTSSDCLAPALLWHWQKQQQSQHSIRFVRLLANDLSQLSEVAHTLQQYPRVKFVVYCDSVMAINTATAHGAMRSTLKGEQQSMHLHLGFAVLYMRKSCLCAGYLHSGASSAFLNLLQRPAMLSHGLFVSSLAIQAGCGDWPKHVRFFFFFRY